MPALDDSALRTLFSDARTHNAWRDQPVSAATLRELVRLTHFGPTAMNTTPLRIVFVQSAAAKEKLRPALSPGNVDKTMQAPVTAVLAFDTEFQEQGHKLFPARDVKGMMLKMPAEKRHAMAAQNANLEAGYFILAARALGLDAGPMGGFEPAKVDEAFLAGTGWRSFLLVNLGHGDESKLFPRNPRLPFEDVARVE
jgi:3-hydroxypropanoate dehydrogenase